MDYTKFLGKKEHVVLPYLGGAYVFGKDRRLRLEGERPAHGYHRFEVRGRNARALEVVDSLPDEAMTALSKARGHFVAGWLVSSNGLARLALLPEEEPPPLATCRARKWHSGDHLFEALDFDGDAEEEARLRLERGASMADVKGAAATLRVAFGIALAIAVARRMSTPLSVREAGAQASIVADGGEEAARTMIERIAHARLEEEERARIRAIVAGAPLESSARALGRRGRGEAPTLENAAMRAEVALDGADARMLSSRRLTGNTMEVTFEFMDERFVSVVDAITLHVYDSGVCLAGADELVTLDSLPGVIREAIETESLVITRR
ncbi:MAG: hypothetical protein KF819_17255 [Labilithrix sp.]|nr:hypothetical protein [Labilithrix sp.]